MVNKKAQILKQKKRRKYNMDKKKRKSKIADSVVAPGIDPEDAFGEKASTSQVKNDESTPVTRMTYDEYDPSEK